MSGLPGLADPPRPVRRSRLAALPFRVAAEISQAGNAVRRRWARTTRMLVGAVLFVALVDLNSSHVRDVVRSLFASWQESQTQQHMGSIAAALDAEYASFGRYPGPDAFHDFVRQWVEIPQGDPARDTWGSLIGLSVDDVGYELRSCGRDTVCETDDDVRRLGGY